MKRPHEVGDWVRWDEFPWVYWRIDGFEESAWTDAPCWARLVDPVIIPDDESERVAQKCEDLLRYLKDDLAPPLVHRECLKTPDNPLLLLALMAQ